MFQALHCSSSGGLRRNCIYAASGIVTLCGWLSCALVNRCTGAQDSHLQRVTIQEAVYIQLRPKPPEESSFLTGVQDSHLQRVTIPEAVYIQLRRRPPE